MTQLTSLFGTMPQKPWHHGKGAKPDCIIQLDCGEKSTHESCKTTRTKGSFNNQGTKMSFLSDKLWLIAKKSKNFPRRKKQNSITWWKKVMSVFWGVFNLLKKQQKKNIQHIPEKTSWLNKPKKCLWEETWHTQKTKIHFDVGINTIGKIIGKFKKEGAFYQPQYTQHLTLSIGYSLLPHNFIFKSPSSFSCLDLKITISVFLH